MDCAMPLLGLEAQRQAVGEHLNGGNWKLVAEFTEVESGKRSDRPKLAEALKACRLQGAKLIIAKLDRLARNVAFISNLMESKVEFEAVAPKPDVPNPLQRNLAPPI
jgi:DNA invertase Pin-like site-specific DNA recombinase